MIEIVTGSNAAQRELICDHRSEGGPTVTHVRGALLGSSVSVLKELEHYDRYVELLPSSYHDAVLLAPAMSWVSLDAALAHYRACSALMLSELEIKKVGARIAQRYSDSIFGTMLRTARQAGIEAPWLALRAHGRFWDRVYLGGGVRVYRTGPKDARLEMYGLPLAAVSYYRSAHVVWLTTIGELLARKVHVRYVRPSDGHAHTLACAGSWV